MDDTATEVRPGVWMPKRKQLRKYTPAVPKELPGRFCITDGCGQRITEGRARRCEAHRQERRAELREIRSQQPRTRAYRTAKRAERYGVTVSELLQMEAAHEGRCAICGQDDKPLVVDHDHGTGAVRGMLCSGCNTALGMMKDSPAALRAGADYLEAHGAPGR